MPSLTYRLQALLKLAVTLLLRTPFWTMQFLPRWNRPRSSWTLKRALLVRILSRSVNFGDNVPESPNYHAIEYGLDVKGAWVSPVPDMIRGDVAKWAEEAGVESERIPGYWFEKKGLDIPIGAPPYPGEKAIYALHGGAYTKLSAHPDSLVSTIHHGLLEYTHDIQRVFSLEYRLACRRSGKPLHAFPTQLIDAVAGYMYLVKEVGFSPANIVVAGDSAGGNLAIALVRYLAERRAAGNADIPDVPSALLLYSPWADLEVRSHGPSSSAIRNVPSDFLDINAEDIISATSYFLGARPLSYAASNRYISPASQSPTMGTVSFKGFPRTLIVCGGAETLQDQIHALHKKMEADLGDVVRLVEYPDAIHNFCVFTWHEPERSDALKLCTRWMEGH